MSEAEVLPIEAYARLLARLLRPRTEPLERALAAERTTLEAFRRAEEAWRDALCDAHDRRKGALAMRFAQAFALAQRELGSALDAEGPAPPSPAPVATALPSFLQPGAVRPPPGGLDPTSVAAVVARMQQSHGQAAPGGTVGLSADAPVAPALPWDRAPAEPAAPTSEGAAARADGEITVEQYAVLCDELARAGGNPQVLSRYHLSEAWWRSQCSFWEERLRRDPRLLARYQEVRRARQVRP